MAKNTSDAAALAAEKRGLWKKVTSSIGWSVCSSLTANSTKARAATAKQARMSGLVQPRSGASISP